MKRSPLNRRSPLRRAAQLTRSQLQARRQRRSRAETRARLLVGIRSSGICEGCARAPATDWAHRKARSQGGKWCPSNGQHLCRSCHRFAHENPVKARSLGWSIRRGHTPAHVPALLAGRGWVYLGADGAVTPAHEEAA